MQWKLGVLTAGPPGKSPPLLFFKIKPNSLMVFREYFFFKIFKFIIYFIYFWLCQVLVAAPRSSLWHEGSFVVARRLLSSCGMRFPGRMGSVVVACGLSC